MRKAVPFWKVESVGNDFVLVHLDDLPSQDTSRLLIDLAIGASCRRFGIGSDGLLAIGREPEGLVLRMFNPDGTEDFCGNGIRCALDHALRMGWAEPESMRLMHHGVEVMASATDLREHAGKMEEQEFAAIKDVLSNSRFLVSFELPPASYEPKNIPIARYDPLFDAAVIRVEGEVYSGSVLSTGTAHTVLPVKRLPTDEVFFRVSPLIENDALFPERTSIMWVREVSPDKLQLRIWERGAGETRGCGSGSTAAAAIDYLRRNNRGGAVTVFNPGGFLTIVADRWDARPRITGMAAERFTGEFPLPQKSV